MFKDKLKEARKSKGLSQAELGKLLNVQAQTIGRWENGKSKPTIETINKLCNIFNTSLDYFLSDELEYKTTEANEAQLLKMFRDLDDEAKAVVLNMMKSLIK